MEYNKITKKWFGYNGINADEGAVWVAVGNTFPVKNIFKEAGWRFNREIGWHGAAPLVQDEYFVTDTDTDDWAIVMFDVEELVSIDDNGFCSWREDAKQIISNNTPEACKPAPIVSKSEWVGSVGERLRNMDAVVVNVKEIAGAYGLCLIYSFDVGDNRMTWFTSVDKDLGEGEMITLSGTVKEHKEFRGVKQTILSRCLVKTR